MTSHTDHHEELVRDVVVGDLAPDDPAVAERRASCPECRHLLDGVLRAAALLDQDRAEQQELLDLAARIDDAPLASVEAMRNHPEIRRPWTPARRPSFSPGWIAAALALAAAVLAVFLILPRDGGEPEAEPGPRMLGDEQSTITALQPVGALSDHGTFSWSIDPDLAGEVVYYVLLARELGHEVEELGRTRATEWTLPPDVPPAPDLFEWCVEARDAAGETLARSEWVSVSRSP